MTKPDFTSYFGRTPLINQALTHKSYFNENKSISEGHNERLEFLGDAVLDLVVSADLMKKFIYDTEGQLSKKRASLVNESILAELSIQLGVDKEMKLGRGEAASGGATKPRLLSGTFEALVGAFYLEAGFDKTQDVLLELLSERIDGLGETTDFEKDYKTRLQEWAQENYQVTPDYELVEELGPAHDRSFEVRVCVASKELGRGQGRSKKQAEQEAARKALEKIK